jgi:hypothetical protein
MRVVRTAHFRREQEADGITEEEIIRAWTQPEVDRPSQDHPGARVRRATQADGSYVTVVARQTPDVLVLITTWRERA